MFLMFFFYLKINVFSIYGNKLELKHAESKYLRHAAILYLAKVIFHAKLLLVAQYICRACKFDKYKPILHHGQTVTVGSFLVRQIDLEL